MVHCNLKFTLALIILSATLEKGRSQYLRKELLDSSSSLRVKSIQFVEKEERNLPVGRNRFLQGKNNRCNLNQKYDFSSKIILNLVGNPQSLTTGEIRTIAGSVKEAYNNLNLCRDPYYRKIDKATLVTDLTSSFQINSEEQSFNLEFELQLECLGCRDQSSSLLFYDNQEDDTADDCPCRAPSEYLFKVSLGQALGPLIGNREFPNIVRFIDGTEIREFPQCPEPREFSTSDVIVEFHGCPLDLNQQKLNDMASAFLETYNRLNLRNTQRCDPKFREITSSTPYLDTTDYDAEFNKKRRRKLQFFDDDSKFGGGNYEPLNDVDDDGSNNDHNDGPNDDDDESNNDHNDEPYDDDESNDYNNEPNDDDDEPEDESLSDDNNNRPNDGESSNDDNNEPNDDDDELEDESSSDDNNKRPNDDESSNDDNNNEPNSDNDEQSEDDEELNDDNTNGSCTSLETLQCSNNMRWNQIREQIINQMITMGCEHDLQKEINLLGGRNNILSECSSQNNEPTNDDDEEEDNDDNTSFEDPLDNDDVPNNDKSSDDNNNASIESADNDGENDDESGDNIFQSDDENDGIREDDIFFQIGDDNQNDDSINNELQSDDENTVGNDDGFIEDDIFFQIPFDDDIQSNDNDDDGFVEDTNAMAPTPVPISAPTLPPFPLPFWYGTPINNSNCNACDDRPMEWMEKEGIGCRDASLLYRKCNGNNNWRKNRLCQSSCYNLGIGYDGDKCCIENLEDGGGGGVIIPDNDDDTTTNSDEENDFEDENEQVKDDDEDESSGEDNTANPENDNFESDDDLTQINEPQNDSNVSGNNEPSEFLDDDNDGSEDDKDGDNQAGVVVSNDDDDFDGSSVENNNASESNDESQSNNNDDGTAGNNNNEQENIEEDDNVLVVSLSPTIDVTEEDPVFDCPGYFSIRFDIAARCRGCDTTTITLFDRFQDENFYNGLDIDFDGVLASDKQSRRRTNAVSLNDKRQSGINERRLQEEDYTCSCPVDPVFRAITEEEMLEAYESTLMSLEEEEEDDTEVTVRAVDDLIEVEEVDCDPNVNTFESKVDLSFLSNSEDGTISQESLNALAFNFKKAYNDLSKRYCDLNFRSVEEVSVANQTASPLRRHLQTNNQNSAITDDDAIEIENTNTSLSFNFNFTYVFSFQFFVTGFCRGCPSTIPLFNDASRRRLDMHEISKMPTIFDNKNRGLQSSDDQCYCAKVNLGFGAPTEREFSEIYAKDVQKLFTSGTIENQYSVFSLDENGGTREETEKECYVDSDCESGNTLARLCVNNNCLNEGNPRITLTWDGDDDLDLIVFTPHGFRIAHDSDFDPASGGSFDTKFVQNLPGSHIESIFFPASGKAPGGSYRIAIQSHEQRGGPDEWKLQIYEKGQSQPVLIKMGAGQNYNTWYDRSDNPLPPNLGCSTTSPFAECCDNLDCRIVDSGSKCENRQCITDRGGPRFTLTHFGSDKYGLSVVTPSGEQIFTENTHDSTTGGYYEGDKNGLATESTWHTQSIHFPPSAPPGSYIFFVYPITQVGTITDSWELNIWNSGKQEKKETGAGFSNYFSFSMFQCVSDGDCSGSENCIDNYCVADGTPHFVLTWTGQDDIDISIQTPQGAIINSTNPQDSESGGQLYSPSLYDYQHLESVIFSKNDDTPLGNYVININYFFQSSSKPNPWNLAIYVDEEKVKQWTTQYGSASLVWEYNAKDVESESTDALEGGFGGCFSGESKVLTKDRGEVLMKELKLGDKVLASDHHFQPVYERIYSFVHKHDSQEMEFLQIFPFMVELTYDHMIFVQDKANAIPASSLRVGDRLSNGDVVSAIKKVTRRGVYAPLTTSGSLLVNDVLVSNYIAFQGSEYFMIGAMHFHYHRLSHIYNFPYRFWCTHVMAMEEHYTEFGIATRVDLSFKAIQWWFSGGQNGWTAALFATPLLVLIFSVLAFFQFILENNTFIGIAVSYLLIGLFFLKYWNTNRNVLKSSL